jgi:hypothetical protein
MSSMPFTDITKNRHADKAAPETLSDTWYQSEVGELIPIDIITGDDLHPYRTQISIMKDGLHPIYKQVFIIREDDLHPIRERLKEARTRVFYETDSKLNPRDSYGKLVIETFNAVKKCEQKEERARLLLEFKRTDDRKIAEDAKEEAKREKEMTKNWKRLNMRRRREMAAQSPQGPYGKPMDAFGQLLDPW